MVWLYIWRRTLEGVQNYNVKTQHSLISENHLDILQQWLQQQFSSSAAPAPKVSPSSKVIFHSPSEFFPNPTLAPQTKTNIELSRHQEYSSIRVLTRDPNSPNCQLLAALPRVSFTVGGTDNDEGLRAALSGVTHVFCNTNSWALGIKNELYWGIRIYELSVQAGVKHFIYSSLDRFMDSTGFSDDLRAGHYYGKAYVEQWLSAIPQRVDGTRWSILTTGPYVEMFWELFCPKQDEKGEYVFAMPLEDGAIPFVHLEDLGPYVHWIFSQIEESAGLNLKVAIEHVPLDLIASTFMKVTDKPARAENMTLEQYFAVGGFAAVADTKIGFSPPGYDDQTLLTFRQNFSNWFRIYQRSGGNKGILRRDYEFLDRVHPQRVRSLEQWMRKVNYDAVPRKVLKMDRRRQNGTVEAGGKKV